MAESIASDKAGPLFQCGVMTEIGDRPAAFGQRLLIVAYRTVCRQIDKPLDADGWQMSLPPVHPFSVAS